MDNMTATEIAYKNGYEQGRKDAMDFEGDLISKRVLLHDIDNCVIFSGRHESVMCEKRGAAKIIDRILYAPAVDAVEIETLQAWLYEIAINNSNNPLSYACEEIISRLDGLRVFARERKENETN